MRILVPVDGSAASVRAAKLAIGLAKLDPSSRIILLTVQNVGTLDLGELGLVGPSEWNRQAQRAGKKALRRAVALCEKAKLAVTSLIEVGPIAETILRVAKRERANHIVMGTRGLGGVRGLLLGSVTTQTVHLVSMPVTLVK